MTAGVVQYPPRLNQPGEWFSAAEYLSGQKAICILATERGKLRRAALAKARFLFSAIGRIVVEFFAGFQFLLVSGKRTR
jgi:hypothetical protein